MRQPARGLLIDNVGFRCIWHTLKDILVHILAIELHQYFAHTFRIRLFGFIALLWVVVGGFHVPIVEFVCRGPALMAGLILGVAAGHAVWGIIRRRDVQARSPKRKRAKKPSGKPVQRSGKKPRENARQRKRVRLERAGRQPPRVKNESRKGSATTGSARK